MTHAALTVVGTGIALGLHLTVEARAAIDGADELLHLAADPLTERWLDDLHPRSRSLRPHYAEGSHRAEIYAAIADDIVGTVLAGSSVCAAFYGHPGVFVQPSHEAIRRVREAGFPARMLPAVSAEDCLFADLGIDPGRHGCLSYEATDFLLHGRPVDPSAALVLWQVGAIGDGRYPPEPLPEAGQLVADALRDHYPGGARVVLYEAATLPFVGPTIEELTIAELPAAAISPLATLLVPPARPPEPDEAVAARLRR